MAQSVEHVLGKDEVTGSNPVITSNESQVNLIKSLLAKPFWLFHAT